MSARLWKNWLPLLLWMALIFSASTTAGGPAVSSRILRPVLYWLDPGMSPQTFETIHVGVRKAAHLTEYAGLGFLALRVARAEPAMAHRGRTPLLCAALVFSALYACTDEFHQRFVPERQASVRDVLIDTVGAAGGVALALSGRRRAN